MARKLTDYRRAYTRFRIAEKRREIKRKAIEYKGGSCSVCGYNKCPAALTFHHIDPSQKEFGISNGGNTRKFEKLKPELDKCLLLCHNCHAELHAKEDEKERQLKIQELEVQRVASTPKPSLIKRCAQCAKEIKVYASHDAQKNFCSKSCRNININNSGWVSNEELLTMRKKMPVKEMAIVLGKAIGTVYNRLAKMK